MYDRETIAQAMRAGADLLETGIHPAAVIWVLQECKKAIINLEGDDGWDDDEGEPDEVEYDCGEN